MSLAEMVRQYYKEFPVDKACIDSATIAANSRACANTYVTTVFNVLSGLSVQFSVLAITGVLHGLQVGY